MESTTTTMMSIVNNGELSMEQSILQILNEKRIIKKYVILSFIMNVGKAFKSNATDLISMWKSSEKEIESGMKKCAKEDCDNMICSVYDKNDKCFKHRKTDKKDKKKSGDKADKVFCQHIIKKKSGDEKCKIVASFIDKYCKRHAKEHVDELDASDIKRLEKKPAEEKKEDKKEDKTEEKERMVFLKIVDEDAVSEDEKEEKKDSEPVEEETEEEEKEEVKEPVKVVEKPKKETTEKKKDTESSEKKRGRPKMTEEEKLAAKKKREEKKKLEEKQEKKTEEMSEEKSIEFVVATDEKPKPVTSIFSLMSGEDTCIHEHDNVRCKNLPIIGGFCRDHMI